MLNVLSINDNYLCKCNESSLNLWHSIIESFFLPHPTLHITLEELLPVDDRVGESHTNIRGREELTVVQRDSIPCLKSYSPALGLGGHLDLFGDVFRCLVYLDTVELGQIAVDPGSVAKV